MDTGLPINSAKLTRTPRSNAVSSSVSDFRNATASNASLSTHHISPQKSRTVSYASDSYIRAGSSDSVVELERLADTDLAIQIEGEADIITRMEATRDIFCVCYTELGDKVAAGTSDGALKLFKDRSGEYVGTLKDAELQQSPAATTAVKHRPVRKSHPILQTVTATYTNGCVKCWHYPSKRCLYTINENRQTLGLAYHPRLPKFLTVGDDGNISLYDEEMKIQERTFRTSDGSDAIHSRHSRVVCSRFNPTSPHEFLSSCSWNDTIQFWDVRLPQATRRLSGVHMRGDGIDTSRTGKEILTCAWQKTDPLQLWDYGSGKLIVSMRPDPYDCQLYCGRYIDKSFVICGGSDENLVRIVDLRTGKSLVVLRNLLAPVFDVDVAPVSSKLSRRTGPDDLRLRLPKLIFCSGRKAFTIEIA